MGVKFPPFVPKKYVEEEQQTKTENIRQSLPDRHTVVVIIYQQDYYCTNLQNTD